MDLPSFIASNSPELPTWRYSGLLDVNSNLTFLEREFVICVLTIPVFPTLILRGAEIEKSNIVLFTWKL